MINDQHFLIIILFWKPRNKSLTFPQNNPHSLCIQNSDTLFSEKYKIVFSLRNDFKSDRTIKLCNKMRSCSTVKNSFISEFSIERSYIIWLCWRHKSKICLTFNAFREAAKKYFFNDITIEEGGNKNRAIKEKINLKKIRRRRLSLGSRV